MSQKFVLVLGVFAARVSAQAYCDSSTASSCGPGCYLASNLDAYLQKSSPAVYYLICAPCPAGSSCAGGTALPALCNAGSYSAMFQSTCNSCPPGSFTPAGSASCGPPCPAGTYSTFNSCVFCPPGTYNNFAGASSSSACTICPNGFISTSEGAALCSPCLSGTTSSPDHQTCVAASLTQTSSPTLTPTVTPSMTQVSFSPTPSTPPGTSQSSTGGLSTSASAGLSAGVSAGVSVGVSLLVFFALDQLRAARLPKNEYNALAVS